MLHLLRPGAKGLDAHQGNGVLTRLKSRAAKGDRVDAVVPATSSVLRPLAAERLYRPADLSGLPFATTAELQPIDGLVGQPRALEAIRFGTRIDKAGFNLFVIGPNGARMQDAVRAVLADEARGGRARPTGSMSTTSPIRKSRSPSSFRPAAREGSRTRCTS